VEKGLGGKVAEELLGAKVLKINHVLFVVKNRISVSG
jgi:hypothetical protein